MKKNLLFGIIIFCFCYSCQKQSSVKPINVITAAEMENHLKYSNVQLLDVQPPKDYKKSHLLNATNILFDEDFKKKLEQLDKEDPVAIYCTSGKISPKAAKVLQEAGFKHIYLLDGGIKKWEEKKVGKK